MKELIAMADHPIFQEGWQPKVGQQIATKYGREWPIGKVEIASISDTRTRTLGISFMDGLYSWVETAKVIYLPSLQDLIDRLGDRIVSAEKEEIYWCLTIERGERRAFTKGTTLQKALMKAVAFVDAGLTWNNGRWE